MRPLSLRPSLPSSLLCLIASSAAAAPQAEYEVVHLPEIPDTFLMTGIGLNDLNQVVGQAGFSDSSTYRAWTWSPSAGLTILPTPPGLSNYRAVDVNEAGVIAGDGGYDFGQAWRFVGGTYEMLGTLGEDPISTVAAVNTAGDVTGTSRTTTFSNPPDSFLAIAGGAPILAQSSSQASSINDDGRVVGWTTSLSGFRTTAEQSVEFLPPLGSRVQVIPAAINDRGDVVGSASQANGNGSVPFLYTDSGGMQEIGNFGGGASAADLNDTGVLIGNFSVVGDNPWVWTAARGLRFLNDVIDPAEGLRVLTAKRVNESGVVLVRVADLATFRRFPALLVPLGEPGLAACFGTGCPCANDDPAAGCANSTGVGARLGGAGSPSLSSDDLQLVATGVPPSNQGLFYMGDAHVRGPFFDGLQCALGTTFRFLGSIQSSGSSGTMTLGPGIAADADGLIEAGSTWHFQAWHRDLPGSPCGTGSNLSSSYSVTFAP